MVNKIMKSKIILVTICFNIFFVTVSCGSKEDIPEDIIQYVESFKSINSEFTQADQKFEQKFNEISELYKSLDQDDPYINILSEQLYENVSASLDQSIRTREKFKNIGFVPSDCQKHHYEMDLYLSLLIEAESTWKLSIDTSDQNTLEESTQLMNQANGKLKEVNVMRSQGICGGIYR
ncbi:MAG: hypothetical protein ACJ0BE_06630 [Dehalococcoidia bacterium]